MSRYINVRINAKVGDRIAAHANELQWSLNQFAEKSIEAICDIIEKPEARNLPDFVTMLDALHAAQKTAPPLKGSQPSK